MPHAEAKSHDVDRELKKLRKTIQGLKKELRRTTLAATDAVPARTAKVEKSPRMRTASVPQHPGIEVRDSPVHGKGVFATQDLAKGETLIEYVGEVLTWAKAQKRHPHNPDEPNHTFFFHVDDKLVIDAAYGGNDARWINHACAPNCEADEVDGRIFIKTLKKIKAGAELNYDYGLVIDERYTKKLKAEYACRCGAKKCRGTMLAPKD